MFSPADRRRPTTLGTRATRRSPGADSRGTPTAMFWVSAIGNPPMQTERTSSFVPLCGVGHIPADGVCFVSMEDLGGVGGSMGWDGSGWPRDKEPLAAGQATKDEATTWCFLVGIAVSHLGRRGGFSSPYDHA